MNQLNDESVAPKTGDTEGNGAAKSRISTFDDMYQGEQTVGDTREKLEADIRKLYSHSTVTLMYPQSANKTTDYIGPISVDTVLGWLDRQAAITEREHSVDNISIDELRKQRDELQAKVDELRDMLDRCLLLPLDMDGFPILLGDNLYSNETCHYFQCRGYSIRLDNRNEEQWIIKCCYDSYSETSEYVSAKSCRHVKQRTVEDVLFSHRQACIRAHEEACNKDARDKMLDSIDAEFAKKLRMVGE